MRGFYIEVTNNLLEPKHRQAMRESVWLFMWLLDKITSIDEGGIGKILGGKPIKHEDIYQDLGVSRKTYVRWISALKKGGYINAKRTPSGLTITVNKAKKAFGKRCAKNDPSQRKRCPLSDASDVPFLTHQMSQNGTSNKTVAVDNTVDNTIRNTATHSVADSTEGKKINDLIDKFKEVNPNWETLFRNKTQRAAVERMVKKHGYERIYGIIGVLPLVCGQKYAPPITTPLQLENKMGNLLIFLKKERERTPVIAKIS